MEKVGCHLWQYRWVRDLLFIGGIAAVFWVAYLVRAITIPVLIGLGLAYAFNPVVSWAGRRLRLPRWLSTALIILLALLLVVGMLAYVAPPLVQQAVDLGRKLPEYGAVLVHNIGLTLEEIAERFREFLPFREAAPPEEGIEPEVADPPPPPVAPEAIEPQQDPAEPAVEAVPPPVRDPLPPVPPPVTPRAGPNWTADWDWTAISTWVFGTLNVGVVLLIRTLGVIGYIALAMMLVTLCFFFFSWRFEQIVAWFDRFIPQARRGEVLPILRRMDLAVSAFIRGRLIQSAVLATNLSIGWWLADVRYFLLLGLVTGFLNLVPYLSFFGWPVALLLMWADTVQSGQPFNVWRVIVFPTLAYVIPQQFDNWVVEPLVQGQATDLSPLAVLLAVLISASLFGLFGMILAIPLAACLKILFEEVGMPRLRAWTEGQG